MREISSTPLSLRSTLLGWWVVLKAINLLTLWPFIVIKIAMEIFTMALKQNPSLLSNYK